MAALISVLLVSCDFAGPAAPKAVPSLVAPAVGPSPNAEASPPSSPTPASPTTSPSAQFVGSISSLDSSRLTHSWRQGCPVAVVDLRLLTVNFRGFDGQIKVGELVVHRDQATKVLSVMRRLFEEGFPIERMELVDNFGGDDDRSGEANNTSAFNCREVKNRPGVWSQHAFGAAIDINPVQNPYIPRSGEVSPPSGAAYADRSQRLPGMIHAKDSVVTAFSSIGWRWGGYWSTPKDYQHFSLTGR